MHYAGLRGSPYPMAEVPGGAAFFTMKWFIFRPCSRDFGGGSDALCFLCDLKESDVSARGGGILADSAR